MKIYTLLISACLVACDHNKSANEPESLEPRFDALEKRMETLDEKLKLEADLIDKIKRKEASLRITEKQTARMRIINDELALLQSKHDATGTFNEDERAKAGELIKQAHDLKQEMDDHALLSDDSGQRSNRHDR